MLPQRLRPEKGKQAGEGSTSTANLLFKYYKAKIIEIEGKSLVELFVKKV